VDERSLQVMLRQPPPDPMSQNAPPRRRTLLLLLLAALAAACTRPLPPPPDGMLPPPEPPRPALVTSLHVETAGDTVLLRLRVTNPYQAPVRVTFPSGQTYDFAVLAGGRELWRWSADRGFTAAVQELTIEPGATWEFGERWVRPAGVRGELTAVGRLASSTHPVERTAAFRTP
jgi:Intracellular proteinase inhibitor